MVYNFKPTNTVSTMFSNMRSRFAGNPVSYGQPAMADRPDNGRMDMGGHDPATPFAESAINFHNHAMTFMMFIICGTGFLLRP